MITGMVNAHREALIPVSVQDANGQEHAIDAVIDTGYTGGLTLPPALIAALGLTWRGYASAVLGDGSLQQFEVYAATVLWDGQTRVVEIDAADTDPLVGMGLLYGYEVRIQAIDGGAVTIEALPWVDLTLAEIQASNIPQRADLLAVQVAAAAPQLVALQEATLWRIGSTPATATIVLYDQLDLLLAALSHHGVLYEIVAVNRLADVALPGNSCACALRFTDQDALLRRADLRLPAFHISNVHARMFQATFNFAGFQVPAGWIAAGIRVANKHFHLATTHLQGPIPGIPAATSAALIEVAGYADTWKLANPGDPGPTSPLYLEDQTPPAFFATSSPFERIDLFFSRGMQIVSAQRVLAPAPPGLPSYGSDHEGVIAVFRP